jgi:hypothetical protein
MLYAVVGMFKVSSDTMKTLKEIQLNIKNYEPLIKKASHLIPFYVGMSERKHY